MTDPADSRLSVVYFEKPGSDILKIGCLKKLKTGRKKFFVLRSTSSSGPSRLEYYDSEKKYKSGQLPKKSIHLHKCFNINKKSDTKHKFTIALYQRDDCFSIVADNVEEFDEWLNLLLEYQSEYLCLYDEIEPRQHFEFVWQVTIRPKGLSILKNMCGQYRLCLSDVAVCFYKPSSDTADYVFQLASVRRCGHSDNFFYMEVGRSAPTGDGELWMQVEDKDIAKNLHEEVLKHMRSSSDEFRGRSSTGLSRHNTDDSSHIRQRTNSESVAHGSPRRHRVSTLDNKRPQSTVVTSRTSVTPLTEPSTHVPHSSMFEPSPQSSHDYVNEFAVPQHGHRFRSVSSHDYVNEFAVPQHGHRFRSVSSPGYVNELAVPQHGHRFRSDSAESHGSRCSVKSTTDIFGSSPAEMFMHPVNRSMTPESLPKPITEESSAYLDMSPGQSSPTPSPPRERPERPGSAHSGSGSDSHDSSSKVDAYMGMQPGSFGASDKNNSSYLDMAPVGSHHDKVPPSDTGYLVMGPGAPHTSSNPISIRPVKEPGYMDMAPSSQPLPTVKEGGSGEAYLPMTPTGMSPVSASELKPAKVISYLSDDSMSGDIPPKRAYSVGSRPVSKTITHRHHHHNTETAPKQNVSDNGRSSSAPHLIIQKIKRENPLLKNPLMQNPYMPMDGSNSYTNNYSPMNNYLNSDTDSFMEMDFYRPRTSSESFGSRPRSSSFNKVFAQGHRPRSSSYGQSSRGGKMGSFESVRTTSKDLLHRISHESVGRFSSPSSRTSSMESLRRIDNQSRGSNQSDYVEMHLDKKDNNSGYIDMTLPGGHSKGRSGASRSSSNQSLSSSPAVPGFTSPVSIDKHLPNSPDIKIVKASGHIVQKPTGFHPHSAADAIPSQSLFSPFNYTSSSGSRSPSVTRRSSAGSGRESEEESYVPFEPVVPSSKSSKISEKKDSGKHKDKHKQSGSRRSSGSKEKEKSPKASEKIKHKSIEEPESSYLEYEPADISSILSTMEYPPKHVDHSHDKTEEIVPSKSGQESSSNKNQDIIDKMPVDSLPDSGYMDYEPPKPEKFSSSTKESTNERKASSEKMSLAREFTNERKASSEKISLAREFTNERKASSEKISLAKESTNERKLSNEGITRSNSNSSKSIGSLKRNSSSNRSFEGEKPAADLERIESYKYMEFDPSTHQVQEDEEKSEVKSPTRVRSYIASNTSMESELSSTSSTNFLTKPLPKFSTDEEDDLADKNTSSTNDTLVTSSNINNDSDKLTKEKNTQGKGDNGARQKTKNKGQSEESSNAQAKVESENGGARQKTKGNNQSRESNQKKKGMKNNQENVKMESAEMMKMPMKPMFHLPSPEEDSEDDGYVGLDFTKEASERIDSDSNKKPIEQKSGFVQVKKNTSPSIRKSDNPPPFKLKALPVGDFMLKENKTMVAADGREGAKGNKLPSPVGKNVENKNVRKPLAPTKGRGNQAVVAVPTIRKRSVSSLDEMFLEESVGRIETEAHGQESMKFPSKLIMPGPELHKQNSMPCMTLPAEQLPPKIQSAGSATIEMVSSPRSRHSCSDLTSAYEQMTFPGTKESSPGHQMAGAQLTPPGVPQPQLTPPCGGQPQLNYASLDLGSSENVNNGDPKSPRIKSRHSSSADETAGPPLSYAEIDFKLSESLKNSNNKECKFSFE